MKKTTENIKKEGQLQVS